MNARVRGLLVALNLRIEMQLLIRQLDFLDMRISYTNVVAHHTQLEIRFDHGLPMALTLDRITREVPKQVKMHAQK